MQNFNFNTQIEPAFLNSKSINLVFCPDNNYAKYFSVLLQSIIDNSKPNIKYDVLIFETNFTQRNKTLIQKMKPENFSIRFYNMKQYINDNFADVKLIEKNHWSISTYYRLFIPLIMQKYDKVLYLDSDMCTNADISSLFEIDFDNKELLAITDSVSPILEIQPERKIYMKEFLNLKIPENYFNAGFSLFNIPNINKKLYLEKLLNCFEYENLWFLDQDIMNIIFENKTKLIHNKWNYMWDGPIYFENYFELISGQFEKEFLEAKESPCIIHYSGGIKPWNSPAEEHSDIFWHYARKTPFYEEILYTNLKTSEFDREIIKNAIYRKQIYFNYLKCKIFKAITFGTKQKHYIDKCSMLKNKINDYRKTLKK